VAFLGVAWHDTVEAMKEFVSRYGLDTFEHGVDADERVFTSFDFFYQPGWAFFDESGEFETYVGGLGEDGLRARVEALIAD
jgi:hypothetical protein